MEYGDDESEDYDEEDYDDDDDDDEGVEELVGEVPILLVVINRFKNTD
jgi:hypothetical protein